MILDIGNNIYALIEELYPICRSITGNGVRKSLQIIRNIIDLEIHEVPSGTRVFDWTIPKEWNIASASLKTSSGKTIVDFNDLNLHVVNYSIPVKKTVSLNELKNHIHTIPEQPDLVPYITSYYKENWGFCMSHNQFLTLKDDVYEINIDSELKEGSLTYGEYFIQGKTNDEILISTYICHPSLCNDNLSGVALATFLAKNMQHNNKYSLRFLFVPETIGAISWLALNNNKLSNIKHGLVCTCVGDKGIFHYKKSRNGNAEIDEVSSYILQKYNGNILDFYPFGSDERQFCSPGINLPVGSIMKTPYHKFSEYHTSADNLDFIDSKSLEESYRVYEEVINTIQNNKKYINLKPNCEPHLSKYDLYRQSGIRRIDSKLEKNDLDEIALFWVLNFSDGSNTLLDISKKSKIDFDILVKAALKLESNNLIKEI